MRRAGIHVALLFHGSDIRQATLHQRTVADSPLKNQGAYWDAVRNRAAANVQLAQTFDGPIFVSTPGLVPHAPHSIWVPLVVDSSRFATTNPVLERPIPVVIHAPSNPLMKGTAAIEPILEKLHEQGVIEYRRLSGIAHDQMPAFIAAADVIVDQVVLGDYGMLAAESMAAGRLVLANVNEAQTTVPDLPVVHVTGATLEETLRAVIADRPTYRDIALRGPSFVHQYHSGCYASDVLWNEFIAHY